MSIGGRPVRVIDGHAHCVIPVGHITKGTPLEQFGGPGNGALGPQRLQIIATFLSDSDKRAILSDNLSRFLLSP